MSNQDIEGNAPADEAPGKPAGTPASLEQELAKERDARVLMRDRLRHTEALAAESHALRSRMADELARVTADRDRLRNAAASASAPGSPLEATVPLHGATARPMTPRVAEWPLDPPPPAPPRRSGPWGALAMLAGVAVLVGAGAWFSGTLPDRSPTVARGATPPAVAAAVTPTPTSAPTERLPPPTAATVLAGAAQTRADIPSGAVALPPLTPEAQLAAAPSAAGPAPAVAPAPTAPAGIAARLRKALDGEGIGAPVEIDAASGHVMVADPRSDDALRDRTEMLIRAVYAGASLPEPQIEHRWLSRKRVGQPAPVAQATPAPTPAPAVTPAQAYAARHAAQDRGGDRKGAKATPATVAAAEELRPVLPEGRVTASCRASLAGKVPHRADMTACMKSSCCRAGNGQAEDCRAYQKAYPFACSAG